MYKKHKKIFSIVFVLVFIITYFIKAEFKDIASDCISIVSFALAIFTICISSLIGSPLLNRLRTAQDSQNTHLSELGVIKSILQPQFMYQ